MSAGRPAVRFALGLLLLEAGCVRVGYEALSDAGFVAGGSGGQPGDASVMDAAAGTSGGAGRGTAGESAGGTGQGTAGGTSDAQVDATSPDSCVDAGLPRPTPPNAALIHRYSFNSGGSTACGPCVAARDCAEDTVGGAHGIVHVASLTGDGAVQFTGESWIESVPDTSEQPSPEDVTLPPHMLAGLSAVTFVVWFNWSGILRGSRNHPRIFDFGSEVGTDPGAPASFLYATPSYNPNNVVRASIDNGVTSATSAPIGRWNLDFGFQPAGSYCYGISFSNDTHQLALTLAGVGSTSLTMTTARGSLVYDLSAVNDERNYLGRSPFAGDAPFIGTIDEFRVYRDALSPAAIEDICQDPNTP